MVTTPIDTGASNDHVDRVNCRAMPVPARLARHISVGLAMMMAIVACQAAEPGSDHADHRARPGASATKPAAAPPLAVQGFDAQRWATLLREPGPALVVFTSTDCAHCPQAIERLTRHQRDERHAGRPVPRLDVVVLDGRDEPDALAGEPHYRQADRLFAVDGQAARVRHAVNPAWFGQTPYVALLSSAVADTRAPVRFVSGTPSDGDLNELR